MSRWDATICWDCQKATGGCSWSRGFEPVEGWKAVPTKAYGKSTSEKERWIDSFDVYECPEFVLDERCEKMREILFRGKTDKGEWVEGDLIICPCKRKRSDTE